jgi:hypothetical protein
LTFGLDEGKNIYQNEKQKRESANRQRQQLTERERERRRQIWMNGRTDGRTDLANAVGRLTHFVNVSEQDRRRSKANKTVNELETRKSSRKKRKKGR